MSVLNNLYRDLAIDVGTVNTLIFIRGIGIVLNEPSIIARESSTGKVVAIGNDALTMHEKIHPGIITIRPLSNGAISDYEATKELIKGLINKTKTQFSIGIHRMVISMPSGITAVEKRAVRDFAKTVGAQKVYLVTDIMAAAIGIGLEINEPMGNMIVDIGGGTTEIAVISLGGVVSGESLKVGGTDMTSLILRYFRKAYNLVIGDSRAENIKTQIGSAYRLDKEMTMTVRGVNVESGLPSTREIDSVTIREIIAPPINQIIMAIKKSLEVLVIKPEISVDILDRGLFLVGGGALINGIDKKIKEETTLTVHISDDPQTIVIRGLGEILENLEKHRDIYTT